MLTSSRLRPLLIAALLAAPQAALAQDKPLRFTLAPEVSAGTTYRANDTATGYPYSERLSLSYRAGLYLGIGQRVDVGVHYLHTGLGNEQTKNVATENGVENLRTLNSVVLDARFFAWRNSWAALFVGLNVGLGWQHVEHSSTTVAQPFSSPTLTKTYCEATGGPGLGLGASLGGEFDLDDNNAFLMVASGSTNRLSSDTLDKCTDGAGSSTLLLAQIGFRHRFDLGGAPAKKNAP